MEEGWHHLCNDTYDVCLACYEEVEEERRRKFKLVKVSHCCGWLRDDRSQTLEDLGEEENVYREEMEKRVRARGGHANKMT